MAVAGKSDTSGWESAFNAATSASGVSIDGLLGPLNDGLVSVASQTHFGSSVVVDHLVHSVSMSSEYAGELASTEIQRQVVCAPQGVACTALPSGLVASSSLALASAEDDIYSPILNGLTEIQTSFTSIVHFGSLTQFGARTTTVTSPSGCSLES